MPDSTCYNLWVVQVNTKGQRRWINKGPAPEGDCPNCPQAQYPAAGVWNGSSAACQNGAIVKMVADGSGGLMPGDVIQAVGSPKAIQACNNNSYIGSGPITNYF